MTTTIVEKPKIVFSSFDISTLKVGTKLEHFKFGAGVVTKVDQYVTINFAEGEKKFTAMAFENGFFKIK